MRKFNAANEQIKYDYCQYLKDAKSYGERTIDCALRAIKEFEVDTGFADFRRYNVNQAVAFKRRLAERVGKLTKAPLSKSTIYSTLGRLKAFFMWLAGQRSYNPRFVCSDVEYFNTSNKDSRIATARRETPGPSLDDVLCVIQAMPFATPVERRNRALICIFLLTGLRVGAAIGLQVGHVDLVANVLHQDPRQVNTKYAKTIQTPFFPVGNGIREILADWVSFLKDELGWTDSDPLFPKTAVGHDGNMQFVGATMLREHWQTTEPIRVIFSAAFANVGLPYRNPHTIRKTLVAWAYKACRGAEDWKAVSLGLGHENLLTTFINYGPVALDRRSEIMRELAGRTKPAASGNLEIEAAVAAFRLLLAEQLK